MKLTFAKAFILLIAVSLSWNTLIAQVPQLFNYQGIARDAKGNPLSNKQMAVKLAVLPAADATQPEYEETQLVNTNEFGLYTLQIGNGNRLSGEMKNVKWETGNKYIRVAIDPAGGTNFADAGTNQLLSVPYAIYADKAGATATAGNDKTRTGVVNSNAAHVAGDVNYLTKFTALNTIGKSLLYDNGVSVGLGTSTPSAAVKLHLYTAAGNAEFIRMQNLNATGFSKFLMHNDNASNYATFTKYGSAYAGGYPGIASQFPYANMLAFGNNLGPFLLANNGNVGIGIVTAGTTKLYLNAQQNTGYLGIGGSALPAANVHFNNNTAGDTLRITNSTTGHLATDGLEIRNTGNAAWITNKENANLTLGTNNINKVFISNSAKHMVGVGSAPSNNFSVYSGGFSDTVGIALDNGSDYFNISENTEGKIVFGANALSLAGSTPILTMDDDGINGVGIGTTSPEAKLHVMTNADTAGLFQSNSATYTPGILVGQYTGFNVSDHIGVYGYAMPSSATNYGIGVRGSGGWYGLYGMSSITGVSNYGVGAYAYSNGNAYGVDAVAGLNNANGGNKYGVYSFATNGANNYGVYAPLSGLQSGNATAIWGRGKQTGVYGQADSASASQTDYVGVNNGFKEAIGVFGKGNMTNGAFLQHVSIGVAGSAISSPNYWNIGLYGEANNAIYNYAVYGRAPISAGVNYAGYFDGDVDVNGNLAKSSGTFKIDHPLDPANKYLIHSFVESPDMMNVYNGNIVSDASGFATVTLPSYFEAENKDFKYQLTVLDNSNDFVMAKVSREVANNTFEIRTSKPGVKVSWQVSGVRQDAWANAHRIVDEVEKSATDKGSYIHPELFGAPASQKIGPKGRPHVARVLLPGAEEHQRDIESKEKAQKEKWNKQDQDLKNMKDKAPLKHQDKR